MVTLRDRTLVCRHCRTLLAEVASQANAVADVVPAVGSYYVRGDIADRHSEPVREELNGWYVFNPADVAQDLGHVGEQRRTTKHSPNRCKLCGNGQVELAKSRFDLSWVGRRLKAARTVMPGGLVLVYEHAYQSFYRGHIVFRNRSSPVAHTYVTLGW